MATILVVHKRHSSSRNARKVESVKSNNFPRSTREQIEEERRRKMERECCVSVVHADKLIWVENTRGGIRERIQRLVVRGW